MTSALLYHQHTTQTTSATTTAAATMAWSNERFGFSCVDHIGLKQLWKLISVDSRNNKINVNKSKNNNKKSNTNKSNSNNNNNKNFISNSHSQQPNANIHNQKKITDISCHAKQQQQINAKNNNTASEEKISENIESFSYYITNRETLTANRRSLIKFLAINALELSAAATTALLQQNVSTHEPEINITTEKALPDGWMQLSGHPESIVPTMSGIVRKRVKSLNDSEIKAYQLLSAEPEVCMMVPQFYGTLQQQGESFIELQDLLSGFKDPCVMDIKMGCRTFLESEVTNTTLRPDLYQKMIAVDATAPSMEEHEAQAITKLRYMQFRESMSSSHSRGFRIEALRLRGNAPSKNLKTVRTREQIAQTIEKFLDGRRSTSAQLINRLKLMRHMVEQSPFFQRHEVVGASIFIVYDEQKVGAWMIDFAKSQLLPLELSVSHRADWVPGNREEGLLKGMDELIAAFESSFTA